MASFYENIVPQSSSSSAIPEKSSTLLIMLILLLVPGLLAYELVTGKDSYVIAIFMAILGGLVIIARPFWGLIFFIGLLYIRPEESIPAIQGLRLPLIVSVVTLIAVIFQKLLNKEALVKSPLNYMIIMFGISVVLSAIQLGTTDIAAQDIGKIVILVLLVLNLVIKKKDYYRLSISIIIFTAYIAIYSIYLYMTGAALIDHGVFRSQATGIFADPNDLAGTIVAGLAMSLFQSRVEMKIARVFYIVLSAIFVWAIVLTNSRGGMLALVTVLGSFTYMSVPKKTHAIILAVLVAGSFLLLKGGRSTNFDASEESANTRFWFWSTGVEELIQHPLLGVGYGGFPDINGGMTAHNSFVLCFGETGMLGYFFWIGCIYYSLKNFKKSSNISNNNIMQLEGTKLALVGFLFSAFWISRTYVPILYLLISLPVAQQVSSGDYSETLKLIKSQKNKDAINIFIISFISVLIIYIIAIRNR